MITQSYIVNSFTKHLEPPDYKHWLENTTIRLIEGFARWYLSEHEINHQSGLQTFIRFFRMYWREEMGRELPQEIGRGLTNLVNVKLTQEFNLDLTGKTQPSVNIDDLLFTTYHLLTACDIAFPTIRTLFQLNTVRKMMTSTSARPGTLVESSGYAKGNDALKWKDIELFMVKHPEDLKCQVLLMRVTHRLNKGKRNRGVSPVFTYTERNDNLGLCVIQDILMYAFLDDAFDSPYIQSPRDIWRVTDVPDHRFSTPIHFKKDVQEIPVFRRAMKDESGIWVTDPVGAYRYTQAQEYEKAASACAGFKEKGSLYKYRKGAAANLRHFDEYSRNIIMGHKKGGTFAHYVSVRDDTQSVFMQTPARNALISLASNASLTRDASAPQELTAARKEAIETNPELQMLIRGCASTREALISKFNSIKKAAEAQDIDYKHLKKLQELADLEFKNRDADTIDDKEFLEDRIRSLELRLELHKLHVPQPMKRLIKFGKAGAKAKKNVNQDYPMESKTGLECPVCLGREDLHPQAKQYRFSRKDTLRRHFDNTHKLQTFFKSPGRPCDWPGYSFACVSLPGYMNHLAKSHKVLL
ncbi:uncharacterized protein ASPGLDRAFT_1496032 [Aspergillus glaucus CBS 516.65]|uniref:FluG domain-containing protein n=1 Tax=Aspergillus glaucus CBS 516.65 TaxID=1160497 RepID=A0A1L9VF33_ASPGL|nr:hypothetical protein ASPGLDRAFT_1496032 [Aspergillus glaucus CBS 516.65]OJJ82561.1 hypothetical protein ASPGLDRAFT_1496032 [Aspergillus glaucus CBS 516.65]